MFRQRRQQPENDGQTEITSFLTRLCYAVEMHDMEKIRDLLLHVEDEQDGIMLAFSTAVQNGNPDVVRLFIETGHVNIDEPDLMFGETALMHSVRNGHLSLVKYLLQNKANINQTSSVNGGSALHVCVSGPERPQNNMDVLDCLLKHDEIDLEIKNHDGDTPLMKASSQIKKAEIKRLLDAGCDMHARHHIRGQSAIHFCLLSGYFSEYPLAMTECFRLFLEHNIDPNFQDQRGIPLIGYAVKTNKYQILCLLLFVNCDINILYRLMPSSMNYYPPLYYACERKELRFINTLLAAGCNFHPIYETVRDTVMEITKDSCAISNTPRTLKELCRIIIRSVLGCYPHRVIKKIGMPKLIQDYIMLKDIIGDIEME